MKPVNICLISLRSYPLFAKKSSEYFGGAEVQISLIAKELAKDSRFKVSVITGDYGQKKVISKKGLKIYKTNLIDFFKILKDVDADIYVERTVNPKVRLVGWWCRLFKKKFVYMVAHDWDCVYPGLKLADLIVTQHRQQSTALKKNLKLNSLVMPSIIKIAVTKKIVKRKYVLWVGRADDWKRPLDYLDLTRRYPQEKFVMICRPGKIKTQTDSLPNLKFFPSVPPEKILDFFRQAKVLVNTSTAEGFPNTFLQAGATKTPILSYRVNPDNYLNQYHCGLVGRRWLESIFNHPSKLKTMGENHYNYVKKNHSFKNINILKTAVWELLS